MVDLKKRVASLEKENKRLLAATKKGRAESAAAPTEEVCKSRLTAKGIRSLRNKLGLTQADFAKLVGVTTHAVYLWENKEGALNLSNKTKKALLSIQRLGAREAKAKLREAAAETEQGWAAA